MTNKETAEKINRKKTKDMTTRPTNKERLTDKKVERKEILQYKTINHSLMQETTIKLKAIKVKDLLQTYNICFVFIKISLHSYVYP